MEEKEYETVTTITEANKNFLGVAMLAEKNGKVTILKDGKPKFLLADIDSYFELTDDEKIDVAAKRIMSRFKPAFEELGKKQGKSQERYFVAQS